MTRPSAIALAHLLFLASATVSHAMEGKPSTATAQVAGAAGVTMQGTIRYISDPQRPWNLSRYYVKQGWLAEAVVALEGTNLPSAGTNRPSQCLALDQLNFQFVPETLALRVGDSIKVMNSDDALHNVMTSDGEPFNVSLSKGQEFTKVFEHAGGLSHPIRLGCLFHSSMRAWIYVFDHPWFAVTQQDGHFRLVNVPPGSYSLEVVHPAGKLQVKRQIEIRSDQTTPIEIRLSPDDRVSPH